MTTGVYPRKSLTERFWAGVDKRGPDECWPWTAGRSSWGYGKLKHNSRSIGAHRVSWELHNGKIPEGLFVCHHCDNPPCCNPKHLFLGTQRDNIADRMSKGRTRAPRVFGSVKLTPKQVDEVLSLKLSQRKLAAMYGVSRDCIIRILRNRRLGNATSRYRG